MAAAAEQPILMTEPDARRLETMLRRQYRGGGGIEVNLSPDGGTVTITGRGRHRGDTNSSENIHAKITAVLAINGGIRWRYSIELGHWDMTQNAAAGGTWVKDSGDEVLYAFSSAEDKNTFTSGTGTIGTGNTNVTQADGTINGTACKLVPLPVGDYVVVVFRGYDTTLTPAQAYYTITNKTSSAQ
jgi:hypothetical protein